MSLSYLLDDESADARVLEFPNGHCWSAATGFIETKDGGNKIFVKDRDDEESEIQAASSLFGHEFSKAFQVPSVVTPCESIDRPSLGSLKEGTSGYKLWKLKEEKWESKFASEEEEKKEESSSDDEESDDEDSNYRPSEFDCWLLEKAILYYNKSSSSTTAEGKSAVDKSLRRKLRAAADRSHTGCLDLCTALLLTEYSQKEMVVNAEDWAGYQEYALLEDPKGALTQEETHLMLHEKLSGVDFDVAVLYAAVATLPDVSVENSAIQEVEDGPSSWHLRLVHFDTGVLPVSAGVSLQPLRGENASEAGLEFLGHETCTGYFMPVLFSMPAFNQPVQAATLNGLKKVSASSLQSIVEEQFSNSEAVEDGLDGLGEIFKARIESMQRYALAFPSCTLKDIVFDTVAAWERDFPLYEEENETAEWIDETLEWAKG